MIRILILLTAMFGREQIHADRVVEEQFGGMLTQKIGGLFREYRIGKSEGGRQSRHWGLLFEGRRSPRQSFVSSRFVWGEQRRCQRWATPRREGTTQDLVFHR